jgi:hypothetical protein
MLNDEHGDEFIHPETRRERRDPQTRDACGEQNRQQYADSPWKAPG